MKSEYQRLPAQGHPSVNHEWLKSLLCVCVLMFLALSAQGCKTVGARHEVAKKTVAIPKMSESFALIEDSTNLDAEVLKRGNRTRGLSEY
jgi:hypothetical protein